MTLVSSPRQLLSFSVILRNVRSAGFCAGLWIVMLATHDVRTGEVKQVLLGSGVPFVEVTSEWDSLVSSGCPL